MSETTSDTPFHTDAHPMAHEVYNDLRRQGFGVHGLSGTRDRKTIGVRARRGDFNADVTVICTATSVRIDSDFDLCDDVAEAYRRGYRESCAWLAERVRRALVPERSIYARPLWKGVVA